VGIKFFKMNLLDHARGGVGLTVTDAVATNDGSEFVNAIRNRSDADGWMTSGSTDAANTTLEISFADFVEVNRIALLNHNFKSFTVKYWSEDTDAWEDFATPIVETNFAGISNYYEVPTTYTFRIQVVILGTQVPDSDKTLRQLIVTEELGELETEVMIDPLFDEDKKTSRYVSGKNYVTKSVGGFKVKLTMSSISNNEDLQLIERLHKIFGGFHVWLCGGDVTQYETVREGYRMEDIFFVQVATSYNPQWRDGRYYNGLVVNFTLVEVN
jgi:hypothetical protein